METPPPLAGLDPAELLRQGAADETVVDGVSSAFQPPAMEEIAAAFPQFEILELIGQGGMGAVYKVRQKDLDRVVALKILPPAIGQSPEFSERFTREARALAKLNHPGIVTIHEFGQKDGLYFILMEFVDGVNLAQLMKTGRVSPREALAIVPQICDALQYAHDQGIVHRDIKPENLLLDRSGRVKVADFGIAKVVASVCDRRTNEDDDQQRSQADATLAGKIIGTPQYMAPEQIERPSDVDHRADIYALGVVFYQMLTGELPGKDLQAPSLKVHIDVRLDEIVLHALEKNPERRYQTAGEFRTRVDTIVSEKGSAGVPAASFVASSGEKHETARFSRAAIVGACWAPVFFVFQVFWFSIGTPVVVQAGAEPPGPSLWQMLLRFTVLPLGLTAPFGTTILGWIAVSKIRRSAGKLHGMWLAVFDGLLFPFVLMVGLIGWFWHWVFYDLMRAAIIEGQPDLSSLERIFVNNVTAFTVLATIVSSLVAGIFIARKVWRAVNAGASSASNQPTSQKTSPGRTIAIGFGVLGLVGLVVSLLAVVLPLYLRKSNEQAHERFMKAHRRESTEAVTRAEQLDAALRVEDTIPTFGTTIETSIRFIKSAELANLINLDTGAIEQRSYRWEGEQVAENRSDAAPLLFIGENEQALWIRVRSHVFLKKVSGSWWDAEALLVVKEIDRLFPGKQVGYVNPWIKELATDKSEFPQTYLFRTPMGTYGLLQIHGFTENPRGVKIRYKPVHHKTAAATRAKPKQVFKPIPVEAARLMEEMKQLHESPEFSDLLNAQPDIRKRYNEEINRRLKDLQVLLRGTNVEALMDESIALARQISEQSSPNKQVDPGLRKRAETIGKQLEDKIKMAAQAGSDSLSEAAEAWLASIDAGDYKQSWKDASEFFRKSITEEAWADAMTKARNPLGTLKSRKFVKEDKLDKLPGAPDGEYIVMRFDTSFEAKEKAVETVTFMEEADGSWKAAGYFIR